MIAVQEAPTDQVQLVSMNTAEPSEASGQRLEEGKAHQQPQRTCRLGRSYTSEGQDHPGYAEEEGKDCAPECAAELSQNAEELYGCHRPHL